LSAACASRRAARHFPPPTEAQKQEALAAVAAAQERAASLMASRLLYDARMSPGKGPAVPGTLAVIYDGRDVTRASLTGPFGKRVAEYDAGSVTGEERQALVVEPGALRAVLSGAWPGVPSSVEGCGEGECLVVWTPAPGGRVAVSGVVDQRAARLRSLLLEGDRGTLSVTYDGEADPWPGRIGAVEERSGRSLKLHLVAREPGETAPASRSASP
jgi:hypothetical protein